MTAGGETESAAERAERAQGVARPGDSSPAEPVPSSRMEAPLSGEGPEPSSRIDSLSTMEMAAISDESVARERYERHAMAASELPATAVQPFDGNAEAVLSLVRKAMQAVTRDRAAIRRRLPKSRFDAIRVLPEIAMALHYAATRMALPETAPAEVVERLDLLHGALRPTLAAAEVCLTRSLVPETYALVRRALVAGDPASAAATITDLLHDRWRHVQNRVTLTEDEIARVNQPAKWLLSNTRLAERMDSRDIRDRLWSILRDRYEQLRAIAQELHGSEFESYAPPLVAASASTP